MTDALALSDAELDRAVRPQWLADAHAALDAAVAVAYSWSADITDADAIRGLLV